MTPPSWLYWPDSGGSATTTALASFSSGAVDSNGNSGIMAHTNLEGTTLAADGGLLWDGRGVSNSIEGKGANANPDFLYMYFDSQADCSTAVGQFTSFTLSDTTDSVDYSLTTSIDVANARVKFLTTVNQIWKDGNNYILKGNP